MTPFATTKSHRIFKVDRRGKAVVVRPQGDAAGFGNADLKVERERVVSLLEKGPCPNLIIDLADTNYFGSEMIGIISRMLSTVRDRGGAHAVINVSPDMQEGIAIMKLETLWNVTDERVAYRTIAREGLFSPITRHGKPILLVLLATALIGGAAYAVWMLPTPRAQTDYLTFLEIWEKLQIKKRQSDDFTLSTWKRNQVLKIEPMIERLERDATPRNQELQHLLWAGQDYLVKLLDPHMKAYNEEDATLFIEEMNLARELIDAKYRVKMPMLSLSSPEASVVASPTSMEPDPDPGTDPGDGDDAPPGSAPETPAPETPTDEPPADEPVVTPADETPAPETPTPTPADPAPAPSADDSPAEKTPAGEAPPDVEGAEPESTIEGEPVDNSPTDEPPADEVPADEAAEDGAADDAVETSQRSGSGSSVLHRGSRTVPQFASSRS